MPAKTIDLLERVKDLLGIRPAFFDAVYKWYKDVKLSCKVARLFLKNEHGEVRVSITVNGHLLPGESVLVTPQAKAITWHLPASMILAGRNEIAVLVDRSSAAALRVHSASAQQENGLPQQFLDLSVREPANSPYLELVVQRDAVHRGKFWAVKKGGYLIFQVRIPDGGAITFSLGLPQDDAADWLNDLQEVLDEVLERARDRRRQLEDQARHAEHSDPERARRWRDDVRDLDDYIRLHERQIEPAFMGPEDGTLDEVIARSGDPDKMIGREPLRPTASPPPVPADILTAEIVPPPAAGAAPGAAFPSPPPLPAQPVPAGVPRPRRGPRPQPRGLSCMGLMFIVVLLAISALVILYLTNDSVREQVQQWVAQLSGNATTIRIETPSEGQNVAPGMALQVAVSANDPAGVSSLKLSVKEGSNLVQTGPTPDSYNLPAGTKQADTKVFTLNLKKEVAGDRLVVQVTAVNANGKTTTATRTVRVGGKEQDLVYEINPPDPAPAQGVNVTVHALNTAAGTKLSYTVKGTDGYFKQATVPVGQDGTIRFHVPGSFAGVVDEIEVRIDGTGLVRRASYIF